jgi:hypothetical protein
MAQTEIKPNITICDPACGVGKFLLEPLLINNDIEDFFPVVNGVLKRNITLIGIDKGFDKEEQKTIILAKANMLIYLSDQVRKNAGITKQFADLFNDTFELKTKNILGTLRDINYENKIDLILTNPPYVTTGSSNLKEEINKVKELKDFYKVNAMGVEGLFMEWIIRSLKPGGKAFIVVPDGIFNRQNDKNLRQFILEECLIDSIISLPLKTFFTTPKKTYVLAVTKKKNKTEKQTDPVFTYLVSEIGESRDINRLDIEQDDLTEAVDWFNQFKNAKKTFKFIDKRCKIQPIEKFDPDSNWCVDRWWTKEEQIELGVADEETKTAFSEFPSVLEVAAENILGYKEEILNLKPVKKTSFGIFTISKILDLQDGFAFPSSVYTADKAQIKLIRIQDVNQKSEPKEVRIPKNFNLKNKEKFLVKNGDYLLSLSGAAGFNLIKWEGEEGFLNQRITKLSLKKEFKTQFIDEYVEVLISDVYQELNSLGKGQNNNLSRKDLIKINLKIPINSKGEFDLFTQKEIVEKYRKIEQIKKNIATELNKLSSIKVDYE